MSLSPAQVRSTELAMGLASQEGIWEEKKRDGGEAPRIFKGEFVAFEIITIGFDQAKKSFEVDKLNNFCLNKDRKFKR